jgi:hypothetical protein
MADTIETQVRKELSSMEEIVTAVEKLGNLAADLQPSVHSDDLAYLTYFLGQQLQQQFQSLHVTVNQKCLPHVALMTSVRKA